MKVAIDIGHGKGNRSPGVYDPGAVGFGFEEHVIVSGMANRLKADLVAIGHSVLLTSGALDPRDDYAKRWGADLLVSLHCNAGGGTGVEAFVDAAASTRGKRWAAEFCSRLSSALKLPSRGVKVKWWAVLRANPHDGLGEMFFIDRKSDLAAYQARTDDAELAILNSILVALGLKAVCTLPRKKQMYVEPEYIEVRIHAAKVDEAAYRKLASTLGDFIKITPASKDAWPGW